MVIWNIHANHCRNWYYTFDTISSNRTCLIVFSFIYERRAIMKKFKISISGMHCASCSSNVERSLRKVQGVKNVSVSLLTNKSIEEAEDSVSEEALKQAVARTGYKAVEIKSD